MHALRQGLSLLLAGWLLAWGGTATAGPKDAGVPQPVVVVDLTDGSRLLGRPGMTEMPFVTAMGTMLLPLNRITRVVFAGDNTNQVFLCSGDRLTGSWAWDALGLMTLVGPVVINRTHLAKMSVQAEAGTLAPQLREGLLLHYVFDKEDSRVLVDRSDRRCDGRSFGATWAANRAMGGVLVFDGAESRVDFPATGFPVGSEARTLAAWVSQDTITGGRYYAFGYGGNPRGSEFRMALNEFMPGQFSLESGDGGWHARATLQPRRWYHLAISYGGSGEPRFYVNGDPVAVSGTWPSPLIRSLAVGGTLGQRGNHEGGGCLKGMLAEVAAWNRELRADEIRALFQARPGVVKDADWQEN
ncbi:MAG: LamG domain-containing protein [bacterium]